MSANHRECGICYETKLDFIRCVQCVNEVCLACFIRLSKTVCPFCRHAFVEPNPNEPSAFVAQWLFSSETDNIRRMLRETHPDWTLEMVNETYIRTMRVIRHHERSISFVRHVTDETESFCGKFLSRNWHRWHVKWVWRLNLLTPTPKSHIDSLACATARRSTLTNQ
jgi:hypothetical protein